MGDPRLTVTVICGTDLKNVDKKGKSDPYVILELDGQKYVCILLIWKHGIILNMIFDCIFFCYSSLSAFLFFHLLAAFSIIISAVSPNDLMRKLATKAQNKSPERWPKS